MLLVFCILFNWTHSGLVELRARKKILPEYGVIPLSITKLEIIWDMLSESYRRMFVHPYPYVYLTPHV